MHISSIIFIKMISNIKNPEFSKELLNKIDEYTKMKNSKIEIKRNVLTISCNDKYLKIKLNINSVEFEVVNKNEKINKKYVKDKNGYYIKEKVKETTHFGNYIIDKTQKSTYKIYDKKGIEQYRKDTFKHDSYYIDETNTLMRCEPNGIDNYKEESYIWRVENNKILKRVIKQYTYPEELKTKHHIHDTDYCYVRLQEIERNNKNIPDYGCYYGIDKEIFFKYFQKEIPFEEVMKNFESKKYILNSGIVI